jgi:hypothetical protein
MSIYTRGFKMPQGKQNAEVWGISASVALVIVILGLVWFVSSNYAPNAAPAALQSSSNMPPMTKALSTPNMSSTLDQQATDEAAATIIALKLTSWAIRLTEMTSSPYPTDIVGPTGVLDDEFQNLMWAKEGLLVENSFGALVDGDTVGIWVGALAPDPEQGVVQIMWFYPGHLYEVRLLTPGRHGSIRITQEENNRLTMVSTDGTVYYFDIPALSFVSSSVEVLPTMTPVPPDFTPAPPGTDVAPTGYPLP